MQDWRLRLPFRGIPLRRVPAGPQGERGAHGRGGNHKLAAALDQLREGVPLNWSQMEDDAELPVLALLWSVARESRELPVGDAPHELRASLLEGLAARLPQPKPEAPVRAQPKSLAGFSERVTVLTQVDEEVPPLITNAPQWIAATTAASFVAMLVLSTVLSFFRTTPQSAFTWIEVKQGATVLLKNGPPAGRQAADCSDPRVTSPASRRTFYYLPPDRQQLQSNVGFPVDFFPPTFAASTGGSTLTTFYLTLQDTAVAPCVSDIPDPADSTTMVKLSYTLRRQEAGGALSTPITVFHAKGQTASLDVGDGAWKQVWIGDARGVYWRGRSYTDIDMQDPVWSEDVSVMMVERGDVVTTIVGYAKAGVTEEALTALVTVLGKPWGGVDAPPVVRATDLFPPGESTALER